MKLYGIREQLYTNNGNLYSVRMYLVSVEVFALRRVIVYHFYLCYGSLGTATRRLGFRP